MSDTAIAVLADFVKGGATFEELQDALEDVVRFRYADTNERSVEILTSKLPKTSFRQEDVEALLQRFLEGKITARESSDWAATVRLLDCFELEAPHTHIDVVWDVLDQLASPDAWDTLTTESAIALLHRLYGR